LLPFIQTALSKAENAATAAASASAAGGFTAGSDWLAPRLVSARTKLNLERAAETMARAVSSCRTVSDLPKLEAAILAAKKIGAHELDSAAYIAAKELRNRLDAAAKAKTALENAVRALQKAQTRPEECVLEAEKAITAAEQHGQLLESEIAAAREAVTTAQTASAAEEKLAKALREGAGVAALSLAIKDAAAAGVQQVNEARKVLKLMQNLEAAVSAATTEGPSARHSLQAKISSAESGGVPRSMISEARNTLHKLLITDVRAELDAALKLTTTKAGESRQAPAQRLATLRAVLEKVDSILSVEEHEHPISTMRAPTRTVSSASTDGNDGSGGGGGGGSGAATPPLMQESTVFGGRLHTQVSNVSQAASLTSSMVSTPRWSTLSGNGGGIGGGGNVTVASHLCTSGELAYLGRECTAIELRILVMNDMAAVWFEPKDDFEDNGGGGSSENCLPGSSSSSSSSSSLSSEFIADASLWDYEDAVAVRRMARQARQRLHQEELEQARFEREKAEEARLHRELQLREKSAREAIEKERAEKARAERAERLAAIEAQKAERRERERIARAEREKERQAREAAAKEHFVLLQRRRKMLADQSRAAHMAQLLAEQQAQQTAGLFSPPTSPAPMTMMVPQLSNQEMLLPLGSAAVSTSGVMQLLSFADQQAADENTRLQEALLRNNTSTATATSSLPGSNSHTTLWNSMDSSENVLLSTKINATGINTATALPTNQNSTTSTATSLFGDLGGASWLSTNPSLSTSTIPLATTLTPPRHTSSTTNSTTTPNRTISGTGLMTSSSPSSLMWGSADSLLTSGGGALASTTGNHQTHHQSTLLHQRSLGSSSGLWSSLGSDVGAGGGVNGSSTGGAHAGLNTSMLGLYPPPQPTTTSTPTRMGPMPATEPHSPSQLRDDATATAAHFRLPSETSLFSDFLPSTEEL
jgi:hypothetical protein